jgi:predicted Zn-dependent protease
MTARLQLRGALLSGLLFLPLPASAQDCARSRPRETLQLASPLLLPAAHPPADPPLADYRHRLRTTPLGWPLQATWCVWVEPADAATSSSLPERRWSQAVAGALAEWRTLLPLQIVSVPEQAQVTIWRRRPPLAQDAAGRQRASHGRAVLSLVRQGSDPSSSPEPRVRVFLSPDQRLEAIQATALHELGHAFGLWGHSDVSTDAMAATPGSDPILRLSERDRATVRWLYAQPTPFRSDL